jgi:hypothetical protein
MPILRDIPITLTVEGLLAAQKQSERHPALMAVAKEAIALGETLFAPAAVYDEFEVLSVAGERVILCARDQAPRFPCSDTPLLRVGPKADLLAPAKRLLVAVFTIGPALEARVGELYGAGEALLSYMLDCVGVMALGMVGERLRRLAEEWAAARGWGVSPALSPGSLVGWPVEGQRELCALLPLANIGVRLNKYCVLEPHKSVSLIIGLGPGYESHRVGSVCHYCTLKDSCWRRRESEQISKSQISKSQISKSQTGNRRSE